MSLKIDELLSPKQREFFFADDVRINLLTGSVRSGKTWISLLKFARAVWESDKSAKFLICGYTLATLKRNCLDLLLDLVGNSNFVYSLNKKEGRLFGRQLFIEGAGDSTSEQKIRGMTLNGAYCDEITLYNENFVSMLLTRLSQPNAKLYATCNPDSPLHYIKTKFIDRAEDGEIDCKVWHFVLTDNAFLSKEYIKNLSSEFSGVFYDRYILGLWVKAEGLVYPMFGDDCIPPDEDRKYSEYCISMDYGIQNPTAMLLWGYCDGVWYLMKEYYHSGRDSNVQKTDEEYYAELEKLYQPIQADLSGKRIDLIIDPSASSFIALCRQKGAIRVLKANNTVIEGIQHTASALSNGKIKICRCCSSTIKEFGLYSWDPDSDQDAVIKENDHAMDAVRYFVQTKRIYRDINRSSEPYHAIF